MKFFTLIVFDWRSNSLKNSSIFLSSYYLNTHFTFLLSRESQLKIIAINMKDFSYIFRGKAPLWTCLTVTHSLTTVFVCLISSKIKDIELSLCNKKKRFYAKYVNIDALPQLHQVVCLSLTQSDVTLFTFWFILENRA